MRMWVPHRVRRVGGLVSASAQALVWNTSDTPTPLPVIQRACELNSAAPSGFPVFAAPRRAHRAHGAWTVTFTFPSRRTVAIPPSATVGHDFDRQYRGSTTKSVAFSLTGKAPTVD